MNVCNVHMPTNLTGAMIQWISLTCVTSILDVFWFWSHDVFTVLWLSPCIP
jgi:hypothetical protein